ncbi:flagellar hook capping FlgD N-terminal domain-containing protein [Sulfitobacter sp. S190]|uniref:flagellar hook capping FlgD N-terminal domain-containing protein n=1 Tax=Sulfitobacter sp. S190 TaxID=2867022 RepID=UPI0021A6013E|nr:flagellar hook capping FlgD N-terminal domain-containing protein [Sulfitobacter sp. S190]UWR22382.1 hypothetical protein K3756_17250 [Sulfitobacter sp. S190]
MLTPTLTNGATATGSAAATAAATAEKKAALSSDFETFLKMLTAQAENQDPLEPIDSSEYAAQLAQFSMVEQQVLSNDLLTALSAQFGSTNMAQMAGWIGMEARTSVPVMFTGTPVSLNPTPAAGSDEMAVVVFDQSGQAVDRIVLPATTEPISWAGVQQDGSPIAAGQYRFELESMTAGEVVTTEPLEAYGRITEVRSGQAGTEVLFEGGSSALSSSITALRAPV